MRTLSVILLLVLCVACRNTEAPLSMDYSQYTMNQTDDRYAIGVSAQYAGVLHNRIIQAGGCNFPDIPAADGGSKVYYDAIYAATLPLSKEPWTQIGKLPVPAAYGATACYGNSLYLIGGQSADGPLKSVFRLSLQEGEATLEQLPDLPYAVDNATCAVGADGFYLIGGNADGQPTGAVLHYTFGSDSSTRVLPSLPDGNRLQAVSAVVDNQLFVMGGYCPPSPDKEGYLQDACYRLEGDNWIRIATPTDASGQIVSFSGGCAIAMDDHQILCVGGVNRSIFPIGLNGVEKGKTWLSHPVEWYQFNRRVMIYNTQNDTWTQIGEHEGAARAGAALVRNRNSYFVLQGEIMPGIRTPKITEIKIKP